jgi:hypothetical protein
LRSYDSAAELEWLQRNQTWQKGIKAMKTLIKNGRVVTAVDDYLQRRPLMQRD